MRTEFEIQITLKKGDDWINITKWTAKKQGHVMVNVCSFREQAIAADSLFRS